MQLRYPQIERRKRLLGWAFIVAGLGALGLLWWSEEFPHPAWLWLAFTAAFVVLSWRSVEIGERLFVSPTVMVAMTAAVVFGADTAALGVALMAAAGPLQPDDLKHDRVFEPAVNFGQLVITAAAAVLVLELFIPDVVTPTNMWRIAVGAALASTVYNLINFNLVRFIVRNAFGEVVPWSRMNQSHLPYLGMGFLGGLLGATYHILGDVTLPLIGAVFFVGEMTFSSWAQLRESREATLRGFVKALEAKDLYTRGHTERVAHFTQVIGDEMDFGPDMLERLRWGALLHDVGKLAVPKELIRKNAGLTDEEYLQMQEHVHSIEDILAEVGFLQHVVEDAAGHHIHFDGSGYGGAGWEPGQQPTLAARVLSVADAFDAMTSTRSYRVALTQDYAFAELRRNAGTQFDPAVVEALVRGLDGRGERYGSSRIWTEEEARRLAEEVEQELTNPYRKYG
ncbi:MAG: HD-GYP domain-containing protein [Acidimicrobiia bacterium]